jgi:glutathione synthase/RimK-type ligase-like ATP-grasp enzyme
MLGKKVYTCTSRDRNLKKLASNKMRDNWTKIVQYIIKYKQKWERVVTTVTKEMK